MTALCCISFQFQHIDGFQFYLEVLESDQDLDDDLIDRFAINISTPIRGFSLPQIDYSGVFEVATLNISIFVTCRSGFTGELCNINNINECVGVTCGQNQICVDGILNFTCECVPGYTGPDCMEEIGNSNSNKSIPVVLLFITGSTIIAAVTVLCCVFCIIKRKKKRGKTHAPSSSQEYASLVSKISMISYTVKTKVCTTHQNVPMLTLFVRLVCVLGHFGVQYTLSFLQCTYCN